MNKKLKFKCIETSTRKLEKDVNAFIETLAPEDLRSIQVSKETTGTIEPEETFLVTIIYTVAQ